MEESLVKYILLLSDEAKKDVLEIADWYESARIGLGDAFILSLEASFAQITRNPKIFQLHELGVRFAFTKRFPYRIIFEIDGDIIVVYAILHMKRNPTIWNARLT